MFLKCDVNASVENRRLDGNVGVFPRVELLDGQTGRKLKVDDDEAWDIERRERDESTEVLERRACITSAKFDGLQRRVFDALRRCKSKCEGNEERFATLVKTVTAYASNAIEKQDPKYRRIRTSGKAFTERVKIVESGGVFASVWVREDATPRRRGRRTRRRGSVRILKRRFRRVPREQPVHQTRTAKSDTTPQSFDRLIILLYSFFHGTDGR